ncbi:hypothetical protein ACFWN7_11690 [Agromyces sp. NPDC058484]|uniref:hypothetical protein n=1 Tax=Agromyces sp. NPDC058484 TaxID=3346524 RepID=UPI0036607021
MSLADAEGKRCGPWRSVAVGRASVEVDPEGFPPTLSIMPPGWEVPIVIAKLDLAYVSIGEHWSVELDWKEEALRDLLIDISRSGAVVYRVGFLWKSTVGTEIPGRQRSGVAYLPWMPSGDSSGD